MQDREVLAIDRIPVRLALHALTAAECLTYAARHHFSARLRHPMRHPLMHQLDSNPDCAALAIVMEGVPVALCFYHDRTRGQPARSVVLHNFMVAPYLRGRGLGSLLGLHLLRVLAGEAAAGVSLDIEFPLPAAAPPMASPLVAGLAAARNHAWRDEALATLRERIAAEEARLAPRILSSLIRQPGFRERLARKGCMIGALSGRNAFFDQVNGIDWPPHATVQAFHTRFDHGLEARLPQVDFLLLDGDLLAAQRPLVERLLRSACDVPLLVAGQAPAAPLPSQMLAEGLARLVPMLLPYLAPYAPAAGGARSRSRQANLLHLPEGGSLASFRNRHRGRRMFIAASGPSLAGVDAELLRRELVLTVNDALIKFPHARYAAIMDSRKLHELHGELLRVDSVFTLAGNSFGVEIPLLGTEGFSFDLEQGIYSGYTTAYFALQIALHMGVREIYYLGLDLGNTSRQSHFFGSRPLQDRDRPDVYARMRRAFEGMADTLGSMGVAVYNCSPVSALKCFPYRRLEDVLAGG